jgi:hypothetical protein
MKGQGKDGLAVIDDAPRDVQRAAATADHYRRVAAGDSFALPCFDVIDRKDALVGCCIAGQAAGRRVRRAAPSPAKSARRRPVQCFAAFSLSAAQKLSADPVVDRRSNCRR